MLREKTSRLPNPKSHDFVIGSLLGITCLGGSTWLISQYPPATISSWFTSNLFIIYKSTLDLIPTGYIPYIYHISLITTLISILIFIGLIKPLNQSPNIFKQLCIIISISHLIILPFRIALSSLSPAPTTSTIKIALSSLFLDNQITGDSLEKLEQISCNGLIRLEQFTPTRPLFSPFFTFDSATQTQRVIPFTTISFGHINAVAENLTRRLMLMTTQLCSKVFCLYPQLPATLVTILATLFWFYVCYQFRFEAVSTTFVPNKEEDDHKKAQESEVEGKEVDNNNNNNNNNNTTTTPNDNNEIDNITKTEPPEEKSSPSATSSSSTSSQQQQQQQQQPHLPKSAWKRWMITITTLWTLLLPIFTLFFLTTIHPFDFIYSFLTPGLLMFTDHSLYLENLCHDRFVNYVIKNVDRFDRFTISHEVSGSHPSQSLQHHIAGPHHHLNSSLSTIGPAGVFTPAVSRHVTNDQIYYEKNVECERVEVGEKTFVKRPVVTSGVLAGQALPQTRRSPVRGATASSIITPSGIGTSRLNGYGRVTSSPSPSRPHPSRHNTNNNKTPSGNYFHHSLLDHESDYDDNPYLPPSTRQQRQQSTSQQQQQQQQQPQPRRQLIPDPVRPLQQPYAVQQKANIHHSTAAQQHQPPVNEAPKRSRHVRSSTTLLGCDQPDSHDKKNPVVPQEQEQRDDVRMTRRGSTVRRASARRDQLDTTM